MDFGNQLQIGNGIYTIVEIANILHLPVHKVNRWINNYWDSRLAKKFDERYSWKVGNTIAVGFHTLIEFYVMIKFSEAGIPTRKILTAHSELSHLFRTAFPFAVKDVIEGIRLEKNKVFLNIGENLISLDGTKQFNLECIQLFFRKLDYDSENLAAKFWPLGKDKAILVDPKRKFGHPILNDTNIYPETIYHLYKGGESVEYIKYLYEIPENYILDAIEYCLAA